VTRSHAGLPKVISRGRVYGAVVDEEVGEKYYVAVSCNPRNKALPTFLAIRLTTTDKPPLDSVVRLDHRDAPWSGSVVADALVEVFRDKVTRELGALPPGTMRRVDDALRAALAL
jgi:mRNA interferase MazF